MDQITLDANTNDWFVLDESLQILADCLQADTNLCENSAITKHHIQRLKYFYSPWFDFEYSESGSYFFATIKCVHHHYTNLPPQYKTNTPPEFSESLNYILELSLQALHPTINRELMIEHMLKIANLWGGQHCDDMQALLLFTFQQMRKSISNLQNAHT